MTMEKKNYGERIKYLNLLNVVWHLLVFSGHSLIHSGHFSNAHCITSQVCHFHSSNHNNGKRLALLVDNALNSKKYPLFGIQYFGIPQ